MFDCPPGYHVNFNKPEPVHNLSSVRGIFKYEMHLLNRISRILILISNVYIQFFGEHNSTYQSIYIYKR